MTKKKKLPNWKKITPRDVIGKTIFKVYDATNRYKSYAVKVKTPSRNKLANFEVKTKDRTFLVLDNYGDEHLTDLFREYIFAYKMFEHTIAIDKKNGNIYEVAYALESKRVIMIVRNFGEGLNAEWYKVPKQYLSKLDELKKHKRPFSLNLREDALTAFIERHQGLASMTGQLVINLDFDKTNLEIWGDTYREVNDWKNV